MEGPPPLREAELQQQRSLPGLDAPEALAALCRALLAGGAVRLAIGDRSGMGGTRQVLEHNGVVRMRRPHCASPRMESANPCKAGDRRASGPTFRVAQVPG